MHARLCSCRTFSALRNRYLFTSGTTCSNGTRLPKRPAKDDSEEQERAEQEPKKDANSGKQAKRKDAKETNAKSPGKKSNANEKRKGVKSKKEARCSHHCYFLIRCCGR